MRRNFQSFLLAFILLVGCASAASAQITINEQFDEPIDQATVNPTFLVQGLAKDSAGTDGGSSGVDAIHLWAYPQDGSDPVFLAAPACTLTGFPFFCRFSATVTGLTPGGAYTLVGFARATRDGQFQAAWSVTIYAGTVSPDAVTSPGTTVTGPGSNGSPYPFRAATAVAYDDKHDVYLQAWEESSTVMGRFVGFDGTLKGDAFVLATNRVSVAGRPLLVYSKGTSDDLFFAVFTSDAPGGGNLFAQRVRFTGSGATGGALIGDPIAVSLGSTEQPEGLVFNPVGRRFLVTWVEGPDVVARQFEMNGTPAGNVVLVSDPSATFCGSRYTYSGGAAAFDWRRNRYLVTYRGLGGALFCGLSQRGIYSVVDGGTLAPLSGGGLLCDTTTGFCAQDTSPAYVADRDGFVIVWDRYPRSGSPRPEILSYDVRTLFVPATGAPGADLVALGTKADDTGARVAYDGDSGRVLVAARTTETEHRTTPDPNSGVVAALLGGGGTSLTGPIVEASAAVTSSVALTAARDGEFALSYMTTGGAVLQRVRGPAGAPGLRFSSVVSNLDLPSNGATVTGQFNVAGWAIDFGASTGTGIDAVHVWAYPASGGAIFLGATTAFAQRDDLAAAFAPRFGPSGFQVLASGLAPGTYTIVAYPHSAVAGTFTSTPAATITVAQAPSRPAMNLDLPGPGAIVGPAFVIAGWALDLSASTGVGVDEVHVWAFPQGGGAAVFVGAIPTGEPRGDVGAAYGTAFTNAGFLLTSATLAPGHYRLVAYAHSTVSGTFNNSQFADITVREPGDPLMAIDTPATGATVGQPFALAGWAIDRDATSGPGVDAVHVWAFPTSGGAAQFVGVANIGGARGDIGAIFGAQFTNAGYNVTVSGLPPGQYQIVVYAHSTVTGTFNQSRVVTVTILP